ncbi:MAG: hypothetical protein IPP45_11240 [Sphingomonadales bacterium]|nr:hypothetical protein [Sphingomonadales bacterium]
MAGWSGGGSLTAFYQAMAENPTVTQTPAGDPVDLSGMIPGDAMMFHAAHLSRALIPGISSIRRSSTSTTQQSGITS